MGWERSSRSFVAAGLLRGCVWPFGIVVVEGAEVVVIVEGLGGDLAKEG